MIEINQNFQIFLMDIKYTNLVEIFSLLIIMSNFIQIGSNTIINGKKKFRCK